MFDKIVETICHSLCASVLIEMQKIAAWVGKAKERLACASILLGKQMSNKFFQDSRST